MGNDLPQPRGLYPAQATGLGFVAIYDEPLTNEQAYVISTQASERLPEMMVQYVDHKRLGFIFPAHEANNWTSAAKVITSLKTIVRPILPLTGMVGVLESPFGYFEADIAITDWDNERERLLELGDKLTDPEGVQKIIRLGNDDTVGIRFIGSIITADGHLDQLRLAQTVEFLAVHGGIAATVMIVSLAHQELRQAGKLRLN